MSELDQDPSANTGRFRAFAEKVERESGGGASRPASRGLLIGVGVALVVIIIVIVAVAL